MKEGWQGRENESTRQIVRGMGKEGRMDWRIEGGREGARRERYRGEASTFLLSKMLVS